MTLKTPQLDRAIVVLLGTAAGDALGAAYEFGPPRGPELEVGMVGGGSFDWEPGEWTDDTSMAIAIAEEAAKGKGLLDVDRLDAIVRRWLEWTRDAKDMPTTAPCPSRARSNMPSTADISTAARPESTQRAR